MTDKKVDLIKLETLFQGYYRLDRYFVRHQDFHGGWSPTFSREVLDRGRQCVGVLLFDPVEDKVVLVEQFRIGVFAQGEEPFLKEVVAGVVDSGETFEACARREAKEEADCAVRDLRKIFDYYPTPGCCSEHTTLFVGRTQVPQDGIVLGVAAEHESTRVHVIEASKAISMLYMGAYRDALTIIAMQWFATHHTDLRSRWMVSATSTPII